MFNTVECPYCEYENDMSDALSDGLSSDNTFDWECENCEKEFEVFVDFDPVYYPSKIVYEKCQKCGTETRDICEKGRITPYPNHYKETKLCRPCFRKGYIEELEMEEKSNV